MDFSMAKLSTGTRVGYDSAWKQWALFCRARGRCPYLLGGDAEDDRQVTVLGRQVRWCDWGIEYEADDRHRQVLLDRFGLTQTDLP